MRTEKLGRKLLEGVFSGRFYSFDDGFPVDLATACRRVNDALQLRFDVDTNARFCTMSGDGDLDAFDCVYAFERDIAVLALLVEVRSPPTFAVQKVCERLSLERYGRSFNNLVKEARQDLQVEVKEQLRRTLMPRSKVVPVILERERRLCWVGDRGQDLALVPLQRALGRHLPAPLVWAWNDEQRGWFGFCEALIQTLIKKKTADLDRDVSLSALRAAGGDVVFTTKVPDRPLELDLLASLRRAGRVEVRQLELDVSLGGEVVPVVLDASGVCSVHPAAAKGGLCSEGLLRRLGDSLQVAERAGEVLRQLQDDILSG